MCRNHPKTQELFTLFVPQTTHTQSHTLFVTNYLLQKHLSPAVCPGSSPGKSLSWTLLKRQSQERPVVLHMMFAQDGALECMGHAAFHHLRPARGPGSPGALPREARVNQQGSQGSRNAYSWYVHLQQGRKRAEYEFRRSFTQKGSWWMQIRHLHFGWRKHRGKKVKNQAPKNVSEWK